MALAAFDTLAYARKLKDSGVSQDQAEAQAEALAIVLKDGVADLATKRDVAQVESNLKHEIAEVESNLKHEISESIAEARAEAKQDIAEVNSHIDSARAEAKQDILNVEKQITETNGKLTLVYAVLGINTAILLGMFWMMFRYILVK